MLKYTQYGTTTMSCFSFSSEKMLFHQLLTTYYKDIGVDVNIKKFHLVKYIKFIVIITYYSELFESFPLGRMSFHQPLTSYYKDIGVALILNEFHQVKVKKLIVIISYYCDLFESFPLGRMSFHQPLTTYYKDIHISLFITKFHQGVLQYARSGVPFLYYLFF